MRHLHCTKPVVHAQLEIPRRSDMHLRIAPRVHQAPSGSRVPRGHHPRGLQPDLRAVEHVDGELVERGYGQGELERFEGFPQIVETPRASIFPSRALAAIGFRCVAGG